MGCCGYRVRCGMTGQQTAPKNAGTKDTGLPDQANATGWAPPDAPNDSHLAAIHQSSLPSDAMIRKDDAVDSYLAESTG